MNINLLMLLFCLSASILSCSDGTQNDSDGGVCYGFDERQCAVDPFTSPGNMAEKRNAASQYLTSNGILVQFISIQEDYYEAVCEACEICPETYRFFVTIPEEQVEALQALGLFNLSTEGC